MYKCPRCKRKFTLPGQCATCKEELLDTTAPWHPRKSIDDKQKSGSQEHLAFIWFAHWCICGKPGERQVLPREERLSALLRQYTDLNGRDTDDVMSEIKELRDTELLSAAQERISELSDALGDALRQFVVNLVLFNFRTVGGGRARKVSDWLRISESGVPTPDYMRPFDSRLPHAVQQLLSTCSSGGLEFGPRENVAVDAWKGPKQYVPPSRFTVTLPVWLPVIKNHRLRLDFNARIKYASIGSFGFSEPSYTTWMEEEEYAGTRLSLGAYSLNPEYLEHLRSLMGATVYKDKSEHLAGFLGYGGARMEHVNQLLAVARQGGYVLALAWAQQMVGVARAVVTSAKAKVQSSQKGLSAFLDFVLAKIARREMKLATLGKSKADDLTSFEYVWVQESSLWELAFLGASCLSPRELQRALQSQMAEWSPTVGIAEDAIHETVKMGSGLCDLDRIYTPSGSSAAEELYEGLMALGYAAHGLTPSKEALDPFTPYFEFYQGGFLHSGTAGPRNSKLPRKSGVQIWANLSESLHAELMHSRVDTHTAGAEIARLLGAYVAKQKLDNEISPHASETLLVIDFTKFGGEMPNRILYPILAQLARSLVDAKVAKGVAFVRSNLKYNTGTLDRYQSGEILICNIGKDHARIVEALNGRVIGFFLKGSKRVPGSNSWALAGEYISLMKKAYLLSDAISAARWEPYVALWGGNVPAVSTGGKPTAPLPPAKKGPPSALDKEALQLRDRIVQSIKNPLTVLFSNLIADKRKLPGGTRGKVVELWSKLSRDGRSLTALKEDKLSEIQSLVRKIEKYLRPELKEIIDGLWTESRKAGKPTKQLLSQYAQRLGAAEAKLFGDLPQRGAVARNSALDLARGEIRARLAEVGRNVPARVLLTGELLELVQADPPTLLSTRRARTAIGALRRLVAAGHSDQQRLDTVANNFEALFMLHAVRYSHAKDCGARGNCGPLSTADHFAPDHRQRRSEIADRIRADVSARLQHRDEIAWYVASLSRLESVKAAWNEAFAVAEGAGRDEIADVIGEDATVAIEDILRVFSAEADRIAAENERLGRLHLPAILPDINRLIPQLADRERLVREYGRYVASDGIYIDQPFLITLSRTGLQGGPRRTVHLFEQRRELRYMGGWTNGGPADLADARAIYLLHGGNHYQRLMR